MFNPSRVTVYLYSIQSYHQRRHHGTGITRECPHNRKAVPLLDQMIVFEMTVLQLIEVSHNGHDLN